MSPPTNRAKRSSPGHWLGMAFWLMTVVMAAHAQPNSPHIGYVYPAGGRQGTAFQVRVGGQFLDGVTNAFVSGTGVAAAVIEYTKPMTPQQFNALRDRMRELQQKPKDAATQQEIADLRRQIALFVRRPPNPAIVETVTLQITMATNAAVGQHELRLGTPGGLSNPLIFCVGQLPEFRRQEPPAAGGPGNPAPMPRNPEQSGAVPATETDITLPAVVNGQILPGGADRYRFTARRGQQLVTAVSARELIPYLADAVPGWFQATLTLYDARGKELAYDDDYRFHPDPLLHVEIPADGQYVLEIKDALYRGREDFVYRIMVGELPFVTGIFPLGDQVGSPTGVELKGWNLTVTQVTPDTRTPGVHPLVVRQGQWIANPVPFAVDTLPECLEQEPNDAPEQAQAISLPVIVNGRIDPPDDRDVFRFNGRAGDEVVAEVQARRLDSPLDSVLRLADATGRQLAFNDDSEDKGSGLNTHHADSYLRTVLPADGTYYLRLGDAQHKGGVEYAYRLRISPPQPDFALRVVPSSLGIRAGASMPLTVYALRKDGFTNDILLALDRRPAGFKLGGDRVPAGQDQVRITLTAPAAPLTEPVSLNLYGSAMIQGQVVVRPAVPAEDMMQAFAYRHLVPVQQMEVAVLERRAPRAAGKILSATPVRIPPGGAARVLVGLPAPRLADTAQFELNDPPEGIALQSVSPVPAGVELVFRADAAKVKAGLRGNLIVNAFPARPAGSGKAKAPANKKRVPVGTLPAIPYEIIAPE